MAGESRTVAVSLSSRDFAYYDVGAGAWRREGGAFVVEVGASSADIRARATIDLPDDPTLASLVDDDTLGGRP